MAFNVRPGGNAESVEVAQTVESGDLVRKGSLIGVAQFDAEQGRDGKYYTTLALEGVANLPITGAVEAGAPVYTSTASPAAGAPGVVATLTTTATDNKFVGIATRTKGTGAGTVWLKLVPSAA